MDIEDFPNTDITNVEYGYLAFVNHYNWLSIPEDKSEDVGKYWDGMFFPKMPYVGWYLCFRTPDLWMAADYTGDLVNRAIDPDITGGVSKNRYIILKRIQNKANESGYKMKIFHRTRGDVSEYYENLDDEYNLFFISDKKFNR